MATTDTTNYSRTVLILVKGGTKLTRRLLLKRTGDLSPDLTIDEFLSKHKKTILRHQTGKNKEYIFFPQPQGNTDLEKWDISMFCFILCETCNLSHVLDTRVKKLQTLRNKLCHMSDATLNDWKYEEYIQKIVFCFEECLKEIDDSDFNKELHALVSSVRTGPLALEDTVRFMHAFYKMDPELMKVLEKQSKDHEEQETKLDQVISKLESIDSHLKDGASVDVPAVEIVIEVKNCTSDKEAKVCEFLVKRLNELIDEKEPELEDDISNGALHKIREILQQTLKDLFAHGRHLIRVEEKCILLRIKCTSLSSFICLLRDYRSDRLTHQLNGLKMAFRLFDGCSDVELDTCIFEDTFRRVMDDLLVDLAEQIPKQHTLTPVHSNAEVTDRKCLASLNGDRLNDLDDSRFADFTLPENRKSEKRFVRITVKMPTQNDQKQLQERFESGDIDHGMEKLQEEIEEQLQIPNVSVTAKLFQGGEGLKKGFFDGSRKELPRLRQKQQIEKDCVDQEAFKEIDNERVFKWDTLNDASSQKKKKNRKEQKSEESASRDDDSQVICQTKISKSDSERETANWTKGCTGLIVTKIGLSKCIIETLKAHLRSWDRVEISHLPDFFKDVEKGRIKYTMESRQKKTGFWKIDCVCQSGICQKILKHLLKLHVNPKSKNIVWNPYVKTDEGKVLVQLKSTSRVPSAFSFPKTCSICRQNDCPFEHNRHDVRLFKNDEYDNVDKYYWKIANMFMFRGKERNSIANTGPEDTDSALIFKMMKNCKLFTFGKNDETGKEKGGNDKDDKDNSDNSDDDGPTDEEEADNEAYDELLEVRNTLMHTPDNRLSDKYLEECFNRMKIILRADKFKDDWSKKAVDELLQLHSMTMTMTTLTIQERRIVKEAFAIQKKALEYDINHTGNLKRETVLKEILKESVAKSETYLNPW